MVSDLLQHEVMEWMYEWKDTYLSFYLFLIYKVTLAFSRPVFFLIGKYTILFIYLIFFHLGNSKVFSSNFIEI